MPEHPFVSVYAYVIVCVPVPADIGLKKVPDIPGPLQVPPRGVPVYEAATSDKHNIIAEELPETIGSGFTLTVADEVFVHPFAFVPVTV